MHCSNAGFNVPNNAPLAVYQVALVGHWLVMGLKIDSSPIDTWLSKMEAAIENITSLTIASNLAVNQLIEREVTTIVTTPLWGKCDVATHTPENGTWESSGTPKNSELDCRGQNTSHWSVLYTLGNISECRCPKLPCMSHLDICGTSYGRKKGRESNW
jgi:hypothetical protein